MSHVANVEIEVKDLDALIKACKQLGLEFVQDQKTYKWYGRFLNDWHSKEAAANQGFDPKTFGHCEHAIRVPPGHPAYRQGAYEVGVVKRQDGKPGYTLIYDVYGQSDSLEKAIGNRAAKIKQEYAAQVATRQAQKQGFRVRRVVGTDGKVRLECEK